MFSEMIATLQNKGMPEPETLLKRYDFALTKKLGLIKLPPAFWMQDPKINPRSDHLFWAALLLKDRKRIDMALSVIAVELAEKTSLKRVEWRQEVAAKAKELIEKLLDQFSDPELRQNFEHELYVLVPEWLESTGEKSQ